MSIYNQYVYPKIRSAWSCVALWVCAFKHPQNRSHLTPNLKFATVFHYNFKAPKGKHMAIDFDDFEIEASSNGNCVDYVEVRHNLIGQPGER